jgi:hypothetical protein
MATTTSNSLKPKEQYQYQPIKSPDQLRMLQLFPGEGDEPIQIKLSYRPLSSLPQCEALSYEWGSPIRDCEIFCEGKILKVTENLLAALRRLRPLQSRINARKQRKFLQKPRLLWIDALCINQEDITERSEQVKLMMEIYRDARRVLIWIGEAPPLAREAFVLIPRLAKIIESLNLPPHAEPSSDDLQGTCEIRRGYALEQLVDDPVWPSILDILASRTYFSRLWTVQEIALPSEKKVMVLCGSHTICWKQYRNATTLIRHHKLLAANTNVNQLRCLIKVFDQGDLQISLHQKRFSSLYDCIGRTHSQSVTEPRDRIFALLGMVHDAIRLTMQRVNYSSSLGQVYQAATEWLIKESQSLQFLRFQAHVVDHLKADIPSWVLWLNNPTDYKVSFQLNKHSNNHPIIPQIPVTLENSILEASGFNFDIVIQAYDNLSKQELWNQVVDACDGLKEVTTRLNDHELAVHALWEALTMPHKTRSKDANDRFFSAFKAEMSLENIALIKGILSGMLRIEDQANVKRVEEASQIDGVYFDERVRERLELFIIDPARPLGRNIFISSRGYCGVGPMGDNRPGNNSPAVQVGDWIAMLSTAPAPVILRPLNDGYFNLVGLAELPEFLEDPLFKSGVSGEMRKFQIY